MKKLVMTALVLLSSVSQAATTDSGTLNLSGSVEEICDINVTALPKASTLDIVAGETDTKVADVSETSNKLTGYKIFMKSANASKLVHSADASKFSSYTLKYDGGSAVTLTNSDQEVKNVSSLSGLATDTSEVSISFAGNANAAAGTYSDTVTITMTNNN